MKFNVSLLWRRASRHCAQVLDTLGGYLLGWRRYKPFDDNLWNLIEVATNIETLREQGTQVKEFAHSAVLYLRDVFLRYELEG